MFLIVRARRVLAMLLLAGGLLGTLLLLHGRAAEGRPPSYIRYAEFNVPYDALRRAMEDDIACQGAVSWVDELALLAAKYGGEWQRYKRADLEEVQGRLHGGETARALGAGQKYYPYFREVYGAVLGGLVGPYLIRAEDAPQWTATYGLRAFSPLAEGYGYQDFDDFGAKRSYGFARQHMGHDLMGAVGTPVVAVEAGTVEALGWNQYGGWRIGVRSRDRKRYWYYAHLRRGHPFAAGLKEGDAVAAGQVIGYLGQTGYSAKEDVNGIETPHLHYGLELVFAEKQKESSNEIWVDLFALTRLLSENRAAVRRVDKEYETRRQVLYVGEADG